MKNCGFLLIICHNDNNGVRHAVALCQFQHALRVHGAEVPADFPTDAGENNDGSELQQSAPRVDRVCDVLGRGG